VSRRYSQENSDRRFWHGLDGVLRASRQGCARYPERPSDYDEWHPGRDQFIGRTDSPGTISTARQVQADLPRVFGLPERPNVRCWL